MIKKLLEDSEYKRFIEWAKDQENKGTFIEGTYMQAYIKQRKRKLTDF
jgi:hypothetical protein